jgi:hypothetical protein
LRGRSAGRWGTPRHRFVVEAPRDRSCARRERWDRGSFRAVARRDQDVDVPTLAPARSRCRWVAWEPVPLWSGLIVANEEKQSSLTRCVGVMALRALGRWGDEGGGGSGKGEAFGVPQRGTAYQPGVKPRVWRTTERSEGTPHTPGYSHLFCGGGVPGLAPGACGRWGSAGSVLRSQGTLGQEELSRCRATGSGCRRSYARSGPVPLPLRGLGVCPEWRLLKKRLVRRTRCVSPDSSDFGGVFLGIHGAAG